MNQLFRKKKVEDILAELEDNQNSQNSLGKYLTQKDLIFFGIAAIVGAGIFSTIGQASYDGGPAVIFLFIFTAIACGFSALAYAEFASMAPVSGSAYTYSYIAFGELISWIIGWALIMEYAIGNVTLAISWSDYFTSLLQTMNIHIPLWLQMDFLTAKEGFEEAQVLLQTQPLETLPNHLQQTFNAYQSAPTIFGIPFVADAPALLIILLITYLVYRGVRESKNFANAMVWIKLAVILLVLIVGAFYVDVDNWSPFAPNGISGVLKGVSAVFFAYIGFDAISTTAEECKNPQKDLPRSMIASIVICTLLYIAIALILTGMVHHSELNVGDPLAYVFEKLNLKWLAGIIAVSAVVAMASVLLVFQMGQPRIWMTMSRDGLLPPKFSKVHPKYKTPSYATIVTGFVVAIPALFVNLKMVTDLCSIGTLFAFSLVCAGILVLQGRNVPKGKFKIPYINGKYILPLIAISTLSLAYYFNTEQIQSFFFLSETNDWNNERIPLYIFGISLIGLNIWSFQKNLSLIPMLGLICCLYLMAELTLWNWIYFSFWLLIGLIIYFGYSRHHSKLRK
ncbi:APC family permease [Capnocytophaga sp. ARDL2]|uniref:APC family permease n=1 Tax=Capnocytophaga sp. ARDL2 TaxID=3238809 RepID=UPI003557F245